MYSCTPTIQMLRMAQLTEAGVAEQSCAVHAVRRYVGLGHILACSASGLVAGGGVRNPIIPRTYIVVRARSLASSLRTSRRSRRTTLEPQRASSVPIRCTGTKIQHSWNSRGRLSAGSPMRRWGGAPRVADGDMRDALQPQDVRAHAPGHSRGLVF